jgi:hypothetical protein
MIFCRVEDENSDEEASASTSRVEITNEGSDEYNFKTYNNECKCRMKYWIYGNDNYVYLPMISIFQPTICIVILLTLLVLAKVTKILS